MTKLEELKAALEAATPGEWAVKQEREYRACNSRVLCDKGYTVAEGYSSDSATTKTYNELWTEAEGNTTFIALAHNLMPTLLEAVELLETVSSARACQDHEFDVDAWFKQVRSLLEKLK